MILIYRNHTTNHIMVNKDQAYKPSTNKNTIAPPILAPHGLFHVYVAFNQATGKLEEICAISNRRKGSD